MAENYVRTAAELERKYNLSGTLSNIDRRIKETSASLVSTQNSVANFVTQVTEDIEDLQEQIDGNITSWFYPGVPTLSNAPAVDWTTTQDKDRHLGDLYYDQQTGYAYRFVVNEGVYSWLLLEDSAATEALSIANAAYDIATDHKRRVFVTQPTPPYDVGDMWLYDSKMIKCCIVGREEGTSFVSNDWIDSSYYTANEQATIAYNNALTQVATTYTAKADLYVGGDFITAKVKRDEIAAILKNINYVQDSDPSLNWTTTDVQKSHVGDIWYDTINHETYSYDNSYQWVEIPTNGIRIFTNQPTPPYNSGDIYLKEFTDTSTTPPTTYTKLYVCQVDKSTGSYEATDFMLQPTRVTTSELKQTADEINISVSGKVDTNDFTKAEIIARINDNTSQAMINADEIKFTGHTFDLTADNLTIEGTNLNIDSNGLVKLKDTGQNNASFKIESTTNTSDKTIVSHDWFSNHQVMSDDGTTIDAGFGFEKISGNAETYDYAKPNLSLSKSNIGLSKSDSVIIAPDEISFKHNGTTVLGGSVNQTTGKSTFYSDYIKATDVEINDIIKDNVSIFENQILWTGSIPMDESDTATFIPGQKLSDQLHGIVLMWSSSGGNYNWRTFFIPKEFINYNRGGGYCCILSSSGFSTVATKYIYIHDTNITGNAANVTNGTASSGIKYSNASFVLRYVIGV